MRLVAFALTVPLLTKLAYKPVGIVCGLVGAGIAGKIFERVWLTVANEEDSPALMDRDKEVGRGGRSRRYQECRVRHRQGGRRSRGSDRVRARHGTWPGSDRTSAKQ
jgi:hypothetical protein